MTFLIPFLLTLLSFCATLSVYVYFFTFTGQDFYNYSTTLIKYDPHLYSIVLFSLCTITMEADD